MPSVVRRECQTTPHAWVPFGRKGCSKPLLVTILTTLRVAPLGKDAKPSPTLRPTTLRSPEGKLVARNQLTSLTLRMGHQNLTILSKPSPPPCK
jgi:hypothetical protein